MSENLTIAIVICTIASALGFSVWTIATNIRRSRWGKQVSDLHAKLLDRFAGSQDLIAFLEGDAGRKYFESLAFDLKDSGNRILNGVQFGIVLVVLGCTLLLVRFGQDDPNTRTALLMTGAPLTALGVGFLVSAAVSYRLCKIWGLLSKNGRQTP